MITRIENETEELDCRINIRIRGDRWGFDNEFWGIQIDNTITPLYCCNCKKQLADLYKMAGGRYGYVGVVNCDCGAEIHCVDSDNIVEYLNTTTQINGKSIGSYHIDFVKLYNLDNESFLKVKDKFGFDVFAKYKNDTVALSFIIKELESKYNCRFDGKKGFSNGHFARLPITVNWWLSILEEASR